MWYIRAGPASERARARERGVPPEGRGDGGGTGTTGNAHDPQPLKPVVRPFGFSQRPSDASAYIACGAHARSTDRRKELYGLCDDDDDILYEHTHTAMYTLYNVYIY